MPSRMATSSWLIVWVVKVQAKATSFSVRLNGSPASTSTAGVSASVWLASLTYGNGDLTGLLSSPFSLFVMMTA